ncbi:MAG: DUF4349 domain-containing protein [Ruminococcaceae bacterium]|nr:DUF4349 domain-containing protein [Oscillospiraceae bacterium]
MLKRSKLWVLASLLLASVVLLSSCGSADIARESNASVKYQTAVTESVDFAVSEDAEMLYASDVYYDGKAESESGNVILAATSDRKIIYSSWAKVQTTEYEKTISALKKLCSKHGAYFESADSYGNRIDKTGGNRYSNFTIRIPVSAYSQFLSEIEGIGTIVSSGENNQDVTESYYDTEARLSSATLREDRVLVLLENAGSLDDILALERELSDIRYEIESLTVALRKYDSRISYATYTLTVNEVVKYTDPIVTPKTFGEELGQSFKSGWKNFISAWQAFILFLTYNIFNLIALLIIAAVIITIILVKRKPKKEANKEISKE